jgi:L-ribulose-5-phosphate 4-epimerase
VVQLANEEVVRELLGLRDRVVNSTILTPSKHLNLSARVSLDTFLIGTKGGAMDLDENSFALVNLDAEVLEGSVEPTNAEILTMHAAVYSNLETANCVLHTHSPHATAFALAHKEIPSRYEALLRFGQASPVPVAKWGPRGSKESIEGIVDAIKADNTIKGVLLANHGVLVFGSSVSETASIAFAIEEAAAAELAAAALGGGVDFPEGALQRVRESMARVRH